MIRINQFIHWGLTRYMKLSYKETISYDNGNKWWEVDFVNCKNHGKEITWNENGDKFFKCDYVNGNKV